MTTRWKIIMMAAIAVAAGLVIVFIIGKYTTVGMPYRVGRLNKQIEGRYNQLQQTYDLRQSKHILTIELNQNRLIKAAELKGDLLYLCYANDACTDFEIGW